MINKSMIFGEDTEQESDFSVTKYTCDTCGSVFCTEVGKKVVNCILCGSSSLVAENYNEKKKLFVIPFSKTLRDAKENYKKKTFWNFLVPFSFKSGKTLKKIEKVFLPAFLANADHEGKIAFLAGDKEKIVYKGKKCSEIKRYEVLYNIHLDYKNVLLNASTKITERLFNNLCSVYDCSKLKELTPSSMKDASYVISDVSAADMGNKERDKISKYSLLQVRNNIGHALKKLKSDDSVVKFYDAKEVLIPVYMVNIKYGHKNYQYIMNGQTGESYIKLPIGIFETFLFILIFGGIVFLITYLLIRYL